MATDQYSMNDEVDNIIIGLGESINKRLERDSSKTDEQISSINKRLDLIVSDPLLQKKIDSLSKLLMELDLNKNKEIFDDFIRFKEKAEKALKRSAESAKLAKKALNNANVNSRRISALESGELMAKIAIDKQRLMLAEVSNSLDKFDQLLNPTDEKIAVE